MNAALNARHKNPTRIRAQTKKLLACVHLSNGRKYPHKHYYCHSCSITVQFFLLLSVFLEITLREIVLQLSVSFNSFYLFKKIGPKAWCKKKLNVFVNCFCDLLDVGDLKHSSNLATTIC